MLDVPQIPTVNLAACYLPLVAFPSACVHAGYTLSTFHVCVFFIGEMLRCGDKIYDPPYVDCVDPVLDQEIYTVSMMQRQQQCGTAQVTAPGRPRNVRATQPRLYGGTFSFGVTWEDPVGTCECGVMCMQLQKIKKIRTSEHGILCSMLVVNYLYPECIGASNFSEFIQHFNPVADIIMYTWVCQLYGLGSFLGLVMFCFIQILSAFVAPCQ